jgi:hypothetical protein
MTVSIIIRGVKYEITRDDILRVATSVHPASIRTYYVEVQGKRFPPKQLIRLATGTPCPVMGDGWKRQLQSGQVSSG